MAKTKELDVTKTGPVGYKTLQAQNNSQYDEIDDFINKSQSRILSRASQSDPYRDMRQMVQSPLANTNTVWGESMFDNKTANQADFENLGDVRAENQPWYAKIGAGLAKGAVLAGTTFLDGTVGLVLGAGTAINEGRWSGLWDNDFSKAMQSINKWSEQVLPNYYTKAEQEQPWYENIFTANFLGDKFLKNLGFTVGAFYSGGLEAAGIRGLGKLAMAGAKRLGAGIGTLKGISNTTSIVAAGLGSATSAVNEGRIEALNNSKEWFELHKAQLDDEYSRRLQSIKNTYEGTETYDQLVKAEQDAYNQALGKLSEDRLKMGNADLLMNLPILMASNLIQFGKLYANGFKTARKAANIVGKEGEYTAGTTKLGAATAITKGALSEGTEEIAQGAASRIAGNYYSTDVNNFYKSKTDPDAAQETLSWTKSFADGINETVNDGSSWEEFFIGSLTGALGMPRFRGIRNTEGRLQSPIILEGGAINEWREYNAKIARENEIANYMNNRINSPEFKNYYQGLVRHNKYQNDMNRAAEEGNEFDFKNAEHAQLVSDIVMFDNAGKIEDLKSAINEASGTSQEDLESIVVNTTSKDKNGDLIGPFSQYASEDDNGNIIANFGTEESINDMVSKVNKNKEDILNTIKRYQDIKDELILKTGQQLSDDQLEELTWMKSQIGNWSERATAMSGEVKSAIGNVIGNLGSLLRFNQQVRDFEGQSHADLTDRYKQADKNVRAIEGAIHTLNMVRGQDDKVLAHTLATNPKFVDGLIKEINEVDETVLSADEKEDITTKLNDIVKLGNASKTYNAKLKEYLENPQKQVEDHAKVDEQAVQQEANTKSNSLKTSLNAAQSLQEFRDIVDNQDDIENRDKVLKELEDEGSEMAKNYRETSQYYNEVKRVLNDLDEEPQVKQDALGLLQKSLDLSDNLEELSYHSGIYGYTEMDETRLQEADYALQNAMSKVNNDNKFKDRFSKEYKKPVDRKRTLRESFNEVGLSKGEFAGSIEKNKSDGSTSELNHGEVEIIRRKAKKVFENPNATKQDLHDAIVSKGLQTSANINTLSYLYKALDAVKNNKMTVDEAMALLEYHLRVSDETHEKLLNTLDTPARGDDRTTTGDSGTSTTPTVTSSEGLPITELLVGNITAEMVSEENKKANESVETPQRPSKDTRNQFYRPAIPELHIEASKEGDFRPFDIVVSEREKNVDFSGIYGYLRDSGAFIYVNEGNLKAGDELGFMIDPDFNDHTIFIIDKRNNQVVGSLDESDYSVSRYEGLKGLEERIRKEFAERTTPQESKDDLIFITNTHNGYSRLGTLKDWSRATADIRTKSDGFGTENGLYYFKQSYKGGRGGDNITIWFKTEPSQRVKDSIEQLLKDSSNLYEFGDKLANLIRDTQSKGKFIATPTTKVSKMMVGRVPYGNTERNLKDIPNVLREDRAPVFGIIKNGALITNRGDIDSDKIVNLVDMAQKEGRLYLLIPNGAGKYSPVAVRVKHFNNEEFNLDDITVANTPIGKDISAAITKLANATSQDDVSAAMQDLAQDLYMQDVMVTWFSSKEGDGIVISKKVRKPDGTYEKVIINGKEQIKEDKYDVYFSTNRKSAEIGGIHFDVTVLEDSGNTSMLGAPKNPEDIYNEILGHLIKFNLPLQVSTGRINKDKFNYRYINSGILTSNITDASVRSTWFTTDYFDNEGNLHQAISPASIAPQPKRKVETPVGGTEGAISGTRITSVFSNKLYYVDLKTNTIRDNQGRIVKVTDSNRILFDLAWAQDNFGDTTNSSMMVDNKILTPGGKVLNRTTQKYIEGQEAQDIKDTIAGRKKEREGKVAKSKEVISGNATVTPAQAQTVLPIFETSLEIQNPIDRVLPENSLGKDSIVGYYEKDGKLYRGLIKKAGEVEGVPIYITKERDKGFGRKGEMNESSSYFVVLPNGKLVDTRTLSKSDEEAFNVIMKALSAKPQKVKDISNEKTILFNPDAVPTISAAPVTTVETPATINQVNTQIGAAYTTQKEQAIDNKKASRSRHKLREVKDTKVPVWNKEKELNWLNKVLPQLSNNDKVKVVEGLIRVADNGTLAWGQFDKGVITLSDIAAKGTTYHEAFHVVFNLLLDQNERNSLLNEYRSKHSNMDNISLEEELAEDFREFVIQGGKDTRSLGRKIIDFFKSLFIKTKYWKDFRPSAIYYFRAINEGKYSRKDIPVTTLSEAKYKQEEYTQEMKDILAKASRNSEGKLLVKPGGPVSNLNERQYAQVRTKAFKRWFGDWTKITFDKDGNPIIPDDVSKVVDKNGEPLVVYHGTPNKWNIADINKAGSITDEGYYGKGLYLSSLENKAKEYNRDGNGMTLSLFVNIKNPFYAGLDEHLNIDESSRRGEIVNLFNRDNEPIELKQYDGVLYTGGDAKYEEIVIRASNQIKSATDNIGTFDTNNPDIRYRVVPNSSFEVLRAEEREMLLNKGWTEEKFNSISQEERDQAVKCIAF